MLVFLLASPPNAVLLVAEGFVITMLLLIFGVLFALLNNPELLEVFEVAVLVGAVDLSTTPVLVLNKLF
jgi:hypothetical protein